MEFKKYMHIERFGTEEVEGIEFGKCYVFPKIDGTNASVWMDEKGDLRSGSRNRDLSIDNDNAGFYQSILQDQRIINFFGENPITYRLYGEWLVPHSLKTYRDEAWRKFYVFDVSYIDYDGEEKYLAYDEYSALLNNYCIDYIPPIAIINNPTYEQLVNQLPKNNFLIKDGQGQGEGIVIKNYDYKNRFGRVVWAKIVTAEFKEVHAKTMGAPEMDGKKQIEEEIVINFCTEALINKTLEKIKLDREGWTSKYIPQLLSTVFYELIREESWNIVKEHKLPTINFKTLQYFVNYKVKKSLPEIF